MLLFKGGKRFQPILQCLLLIMEKMDQIILRICKIQKSVIIIHNLLDSFGQLNKCGRKDIFIS